MKRWKGKEKYPNQSCNKSSKNKRRVTAINQLKVLLPQDVSYLTLHHTSRMQWIVWQEANFLYHVTVS